MSDSKPARIAIKLGPSSASGAKIKRNVRHNAGPARGVKRHKAHALRAGSGSEEDEEDEESLDGRHEVITGYGPDGASYDDNRDKPGAEDGSENKKTRSRRRSSESAESESQDHARGRKTDDSERLGPDGRREDGSTGQDAPVKYGLTISKKQDLGGKKRTSSADGHARDEALEKSATKPTKTVDEEALEALLGDEEATKKRKHGAPSTDAGREPQVEDYRSLPVENFGEAILRGYGWDGKPRGKVKEVKRHANLTGLGARGLKGAEDLGAWDARSAKGTRRPRLSEYHREEEEKRRRMDARHGDSSYKQERERERERERDRR